VLTAHLPRASPDRAWQWSNRSKLGIFSDNFKTFLAFRRWRSPVVAEEIGISSLRSAPNSSAQLVKLSQAERIASVNNQRVRIRISSPDSIIEVHSNTSTLPWVNSSMTFDSSFSFICP